MTIIKLAIFYGSWFLFPLLFFALRQALRGPNRVTGTIATALWMLGIWARFVEPNWLRVEFDHAHIGLTKPLRLALISDLHLGLFKGAPFLKRVVDAVNNAHPDALLIAGDLTYEPADSLDRLFADLAGLHMPAYYVPGNHDEQHPGPPIRAQLAAAMEHNGVKSLENQVVDLHGLRVVGLGDLWGGRLDWAVLETAAEPVALLMHNPDSLLRLPAPHAEKVKLALAGHTHCGQVRLPWLYQSHIPTMGPFDCGWHDVDGVPLFITPGTGEIGLPLRFLNPPTVSVMLIE